MRREHDWVLVAPWYRWPLRADGQPPVKRQQTRPALQKFDRDDFAKQFTREPQRSLRFLEDVDRVFEIGFAQPPALPGGSPFGAEMKNTLFRTFKGLVPTRMPTSTRKLFLPTHKRHYLVVCELHCEAPGFPPVRPDAACQAGFVVRRRTTHLPGGVKRQAFDRLRAIAGVRAELQRLEVNGPSRTAAGRRRVQTVLRMAEAGTLEPRRAELRVRLTEMRQELVGWKQAAGITEVIEGWVPTAVEKVGAWEEVEETPPALEEAYYPLYRVFADPALPDHSAQGRALYFGLVPGSSFESDARGGARFDSDNLYEIRCFVRRHDPARLHGEGDADCCGPLVWSLPTEPYRLAAAHDLVGTSQRPVTIQIPSLAEMAAQAEALPLRTLAPVRMVQPQGFKFSVSGGVPTGGSVGPGRICFFAIPLITIVAMFLLQLFIPIVVLLFGLFFLLAFKFCILPEVSISAGLMAELDVVGQAGLNLDASFNVTGPNGPITSAGVRADLRAEMAGVVGVSAGDSAFSTQVNQFTNNPLATLLRKVRDSEADEGDPAGPDLTTGVEYERLVRREEVWWT